MVLLLRAGMLISDAALAELVDAPDLGSGSQECRFESYMPHYQQLLVVSLCFGLLPQRFHLIKAHLIKRFAFFFCLLLNIVEAANEFLIGAFEGVIGFEVI